MASRNLVFLLVLLVIQSSCLVLGARIQEFYPDGIDGPRGSSELLARRISPPVTLGTTYNLYGKPYTSLRVYKNGLITLGEEPISFSPQKHRKFLFPPEAKVIAPFYGQGDFTNTSRISYGETRDSDILTRASKDVKQSFSGEDEFNASAVFIVTWCQVKHAQHSQHKKNNTFQAVLVTNGDQTFVIFNYLTRGLQWAKGYHSQWKGAKYAYAQVGFSAGDFVRYSTLPGSGTNQVHWLASKSNMNTPGRWIYKVGWPGMHGNEVQSADSFEIDDSTNTDFFAAQFYDGCFVVHGYLTANRSQIWKDVSIRSCIALCFERRQKYAALHNGSQCACLNDIRHLIKTNTDQDCDMACSVNDDEVCGGQMTASVYQSVGLAAVQSDQSGGQRKRKDVDECAVGVVSCHANATCINKSPGYCCQCNEGFYGNGITCIEIGAVQRMVGFLSGTVNGEEFISLNMDTIAFSDDGRAYVSVRAFPPYLAHSARVLTPLTDVVGWMYAKPKPSGFYNGYNVVGARFVRRASLRFDSGEELAILQKYQGRDVLSHYMKVETTMNGAIPRIHPKAEVRMRKFRQEFQRTAAGRVQSRGTVKYQVDGREHYFTVDQFIDYDEQKRCGQHVVRGVLEADVLTSNYDPAQAFLGIAVKGTFINTTLDSIDVQSQEADKMCGSKKVTCHTRGVCIQYRGDKECRCNHGYLGDGVTYCDDADECKLGRYRCAPDADCVNTVGSYRCVCKKGYVGDGKTCQKDSVIQCPRPCGANAKCVKIALGLLCNCNPDYQGDGFDCKPDGTCAGIKCDPNAKCATSSDKSRKCVCNDGYQGDGQTCTALEGRCGGVVCSTNAQCVQSKCVCNPGFQGNGKNCSDENECELKTHRCDTNADCINTVGSYSCRCRLGYQGDGLSCQKASASCGGEKCHRFAYCDVDPQTKKQQCKCRRGFRGNGAECLDFNECIPILKTCDVNALCRNTLGSYECICKRGFIQGSDDDKTCIVDDRCNGIKCDVNARCDRVQGCTCKTGFVGDGKTCNDIDECKSEMTRCDPNADCRNTAGSFTCSCRSGFEGDGVRCRVDNSCDGVVCNVNARCEVQPDGRTRRCVCSNGWQGNGTLCTDVDECQSSRFSCPPNTDCINSNGSYECRCKRGFEKKGSSCVEDDSCGGVTCDAKARCVQTPQGTRQCVCNTGWQKNGNRCIDKDECQTNPCHPNADCINSIGSFSCRCKPGYNGNGQACNDVDECQSGQSRCPANTDCINREGSYECRCTTGFVSNGSSCIVDESCGGVKCDPNAKCIQIAQGVRQCVCNAGWEKNGNTCIDVDECRASISPCHSNANCINSIGSFSCRCRPGFKGDGQFCEDDGTCGGVQCHPDASCHKNTAEGTRCVCKPGYLGDGRKCADIDECIQGKDECHEHATCTNSAGSYKCSCNLGYVGDGFNCTDDGSCQGIDCDPNAKCVASSPTDGNRTCVCNDGFSGNGELCRDVDECDLGHAKCHRKAECVNQVGSYRCRCIRGYVGDGKQCESDGTCEGKVCDFNADCVTTNTTRGIDKTCKCKDGFSGDGVICTDVDECIKDPCPPMSQCVNAFGTYVCQCKPGYKKSNGLCEKICTRCRNGGSCIGENECKCPKGYSGNVCQWYGEASLIYTKGNSVQRMSLPPRSNAIGLVYNHEGMVNVGLDYDCVEEYIYWTEVMEGCIMRAKYDGTNRELVFQRSEVRSPEGLSVDWIGRNLYWTDSGLDVIEVSRLNGSNRKVLISNGLYDPRAILVDPPSGKMYWSDWTRRRPRIETADMDGTNRRVLVYDDLGLPNGLTLVQTTNELCYTDAGSWSIRCVDLAGLNVRKVLTRVTYPFGIAYFNRTLYWTDWNQNLIHRIGVESSTPDSSLATFVGKTGKIFDVKAVQPCPAKVPRNPCSDKNGGCLGLCLLKPHGGYTCSCPKGQFPVKDGNQTTCRGKCDDPLGMEKGLISDAQLTASSAWSNNPKRHGAHRARLNLDTWPAGWSTKKFDPKPWVQIDLGTHTMVTGVATQGLGKSIGEWVKTYRVAYSDDGVTWYVLRNGGRKKIFVANSDSTTVKRNKFPAALKTRWLRILPRTWHNHVSMRLELYGC
ncbi:nidogen-like [Actinia tenebrosa]|uniref:Nidogen-like n=1 Tax=Actinia tenebrosa TaxID=6105 RepID=A0A6P8HN52_ACTTE|nr:nidogen-like [Actinia tenebrosa]